MLKNPSFDDHLIRDQIAGVIVDHVRFQNIASQLKDQEEAFKKAVAQIDEVRKFVGTPEHILGNELTKHGEIAEHVEVGVSNARQALAQQEMTATFEGVGRTAPEDYLIDGMAVQSKFVNGVNNSLDHVLNHMDKHSDFGRDGSFYHIPKDYHETITKILNNERPDGLADKTIRAVQDKIAKIEMATGRPFDEVVKPGVSDYADVQQGKIHDTLDGHKSDLDKENNRLNEQITENHQPSLGEALQTAGISAAVGGAVTLTASIYKKYREGKNLFKGDFSLEDWGALGVSTGKGAVGGAVSGAAIYGLTNYAALSAPFAGAVVSAAKSVSSLAKDHQAGNISFEEFTDMGMMVCAESAIVGICSAAGQTLIPIPVLGAVIGSIAGRMVGQFASAQITDVQEKLQQDMALFLARIDKAYADVVYKIDAEFERLGELTIIAFDYERNKALLKSSIELARAYGVDEENIIKSSAELDQFMFA